jgi:very-short-patch-repair endonuclease
MLWVTIIVLIIVVAVALLLKAHTKRELVEYPYQKADSLFSPAERSFLGVLERAVGDKCKVLGKVRLADVISPISGLSKSDRQKAFNRIGSKHVDFALCKKDDLSLVCAIELDDRSHKKSDRKSRDDFLENALNAASIPFIRFPARASYNVQEVRAEIAKATGLDVQSLSDGPGSMPASGGEAAQGDPTRTCPKCASPMVLRKATSGKYAGKRFWGCSRYPECKTVLPVKDDIGS